MNENFIENVKKALRLYVIESIMESRAKLKKR